jgi:hypothetical protein
MPTTAQDDADNSPDSDDIAFSRSGSAGPFGNLEDPMKTHVDLDTGLAFRRMCREAGGDTAKVIRNFIYLKVHGKTYDDVVDHAAKSMRDRFFGTGPNEDQSGGAA